MECWGDQVTWKECLSNNNAWDTLTWFAALIGMASYLNKYGFIKWFSGKVSCAMAPQLSVHTKSMSNTLTALLHPPLKCIR